MTFKTESGTNSNLCADDALGDLLKTYSGESVDYTDNDTAISFALLYIADKLDSIDTRLFHLVNQEGKKHE